MPLLLMFIPDPLLGQGSTWPGTSLAQIIESARWRFGALRINASLALANAGYDSDVYYGYFDEATPDFTMMASTPVQVLVPISKKAVFELNDTPQYLFYGQTEKERAWNNEFAGRFHLALDRIYIQAGGGASNVRRRMSPELDINVREKTASLDGTLLWQTSAKVSLAALAGYTKYDYGQAALEGLDLAGVLNREEIFADLVTYLELGTKARVYLDGQYGQYMFDETASGSRDARSYGAIVGLAFVPREEETGPLDPPQGNVSLGYKYFDVVDPAVADGSGLVGAVDFSIGLIAKTTARAFLTRDFAFSIYSDGTYYLSTAFGGGISRRLSREATFSYDASFGRSAYPRLEGGELPDGRAYRFSSHSFVLSFRMARYLSMSFLAQLGRRTLGEADPPRNRSFFGLNLTYGVPGGSISAPVRGLAR